MCEICQNWERVEDPYKIRRRDGIPLITNHHPNCPHYNDSLMDVWKIADGTTRCYVGDEAEAMVIAHVEAHDSEGPPIEVTKEKMHREIFENLPEFEGF